MNRARASLRIVQTTAGSLLAAFLLATPAWAAPLFFDDFEDGNLDQWSPNQNGQIAADPLDASNNVLNFSATITGGDIFTSSTISLDAGRTYRVSFDFLGLSVDGEQGSGGYAGISAGTPGKHGWYAGTEPTNYLTMPNSLDLVDDGAWHSYAYTFIAPIDLQGAETTAIRLMFEDFAFSGPTAGNAYFDNIALNLVPLPAALPLYGAGIAGLGLFGWLRRRKAATAT